MAWSKVCSSKQNGGLGLRMLVVMNKTLICKWLWRFGVEEDSLWKRVIASKYGVLLDGDPRLVRSLHGICSWKDIMGLCQGFKKGLRMEIGNGQHMRFWEDKWCGQQPLKREFPLVFLMVAEPLALVSKYWNSDHGEIPSIQFSSG